MAFLLSYLRDDLEVDEIFQQYFSYLDSIKELIPPTAYEIAKNPDWYRAEAGGPHDAELEELVMVDVMDYSLEGPSVTNVKIRLRGSEVKEILYEGVVRYDLSVKGSDPLYHGVWLYDEFSYSGPSEFTHFIEWSSGTQWIIQARKITVRR